MVQFQVLAESRASQPSNENDNADDMSEGSDDDRQPLPSYKGIISIKVILLCCRFLKQGVYIIIKINSHSIILFINLSVCCLIL